jgi:hypothetical protein
MSVFLWASDPRSLHMNESERLLVLLQNSRSNSLYRQASCFTGTVLATVMLDSGDELEEDDESVGIRLTRIQHAQQQCRGQDSDSEEDEDGMPLSLRRQEPNLSEQQEVQVQHGLSQQGFSQDFSQDLSQSSTSEAIVYQYKATGYYGQSALAISAENGNEYLREDPFCAYAAATTKRPPLAPTHVPAKKRAPSPAISIRAPSPADSTGSTKEATGPPKKKPAQSKKTPEEKREEELLQEVIERTINNFKPEYRDYIVCEEERDAKNLENKEFYSVGRWLKVNKPTPRKLDLALFTSKQIRKLATNCGVKGGGTMSMFQARRKIAQIIHMGTVYNDDTIANPKTTGSERKINTLMRITNACFHADLRDKFIDLNDAKKRGDYEAAHGGNPVKAFWVQVSELTNDSTRNDVLGIILEADVGGDERLRGWVDIGKCNLNDFTLQTYLSCQQNMNDCMKAREACLRGLRTSGHHSNDMWTYAINTDFTKLRKASLPVPAEAVYYCHVLCQKNPDIDGKFAAFLNERLKSDSEVAPTGVAGVSSQQEAVGAGKRKAIDTLVQGLSVATSEMTKAFEKKQDKRDESHLWNDYFAVSDKFLEMKDDSNKLPLLCNMSIRVRMLEKALGIPPEQSITVGVAGIPEVVTVIAKDCTTSTSDVTGNNY